MKTSAGSATSAAPLSSTLRHGFDDNPIFYNTGQLAPCPLICNHACGGDLQRRGCRHDLRLASHQSQSVHREEWIVRGCGFLGKCRGDFNLITSFQYSGDFDATDG
ncbi:hypothetical protein SEVIR_6G024350v4 [Setaria viridis]